MASVKPIPEGMHTVTACLAVEGASELIDFCKRAFGAEQLMRADDPSGTKIMHAAIRIGDSVVYLNDAMPQMGVQPRKTVLWLYVPDVDASYQRAVDAGAVPLMPPAEMFWGDRFGRVADRFGNEYGIATRTKALSPAEMKQAQDAFFAQMAKQK